MTTPPTPALADPCTIITDGVRAAMAAEGMRKGPAGALARAILRLLEVLLALLAEFKAGTLAAEARGPGAEGASGATNVDRDRDGTELRSLGARQMCARQVGARQMYGDAASPSLAASPAHQCGDIVVEGGEDAPTPGLPRCAGAARERGRTAPAVASLTPPPGPLPQGEGELCRARGVCDPDVGSSF